MKKLIPLLVVLSACAPLTKWADTNVVPGPPAVVGMATGAAVNTTMLVLKRPWWQRLGANLVVGMVPRFFFNKKPLDWHIEVFFGGAGSEWASWLVCDSPCDTRWK